MEGPNPGDMFIKSDGTKIYIVDETLAKIKELYLSDAWNLKSISVTSPDSEKYYLNEFGNVYVSSRATNTHGLHFSTTGNSMYITCSANSKVYQYTLGTNWSVNTASYTSNLYIGNIETNPQGISFSNTGTRMYITGISAKGISEYRLSTPWDITTARHYITHTTDNEETEPKGSYISLGNNKIFVIGNAKNNVREYITTDTGLIDYQGSNVTVSGTSQGNNRFIGCLSELWFSNSYIDHTNTALMNKFNSSNGSLLPTNLMVHISPEWSYTGNSFNIRAYEEDPRGLFFKPDGRSFYTIGYVNANIAKYNLSTPWDVNTATFIGNTANVGICATGSVDPSDIFIKSDGTRLYIIYNRESKVKQFDMSETWNIFSISVEAGGFLSNSGEVNVATQESNTSGLSFSNTGVYMYVTGTATDKVHQYTLGTPWDVTTASYTQNVNVFIQTTETQPTGLTFNENGTKMFVTGSTQDAVYEFNLSTPWDIISSTYVKKHSEYIRDAAMTGLYYDSTNGAFIIGSTNDTVFKYNVNSEIYTSIYLKGNVALANINYGRGGNFNFANSIINCNTSPSDT
jgi:sugar lactone lactonase YvrE